LLRENRIQALRELDTAESFLRGRPTALLRVFRGLRILLAALECREPQIVLAEMDRSELAILPHHRALVAYADAVWSGRHGRAEAATDAFTATRASMGEAGGATALARRTRPVRPRWRRRSRQSDRSRPPSTDARRWWIGPGPFLHGSGVQLDVTPLGGGDLEKGVLSMRSAVTEPMQVGRLFLAGDAAHVLTPSGAKGMNLAVADAAGLAAAIIAHYQDGLDDGLATYSSTRLADVWQAQEFSDWLVQLLHESLGPDDGFQQQLRLARLGQLELSTVAATAFARRYVG